MRRKGKNAVTLTGTQQKMRARVGVSIITETGAVAIHDYNLVSVSEVEALAGGNASGRVQR